MEEDLFSVQNYMKEDGGEDSSPPPKRAKKVDIEHVLSLQKKVGTLFPQTIPSEEMVNSEKSLRENIYYSFWSHVCGMLRPPNNRVVFILDPFHYNILLSDYDAVQKKLQSIRDERVQVFQDLQRSEGILTTANRNIKKVLAYTPFIGQTKELLEEGRTYLKKYKQLLMTRDYAELRFLMQTYFNVDGRIPAFDDDVRAWIPLAKNLVKMNDPGAIENINSVDDGNVSGFFYFLMWQLRNNMDYFVNGEGRYRTYPKNVFDDKPPVDLEVVNNSIVDTFKSLDEFLRQQDIPQEEPAYFNDQLLGVRRDIQRLITDAPNNFEKYLTNEGVESDDLSSFLNYSYDDLSADESQVINDLDSEDDKIIKRLEMWLSDVAANLVRDDGNFQSYIQQFEKLVSERVQLLEREEQLEKDATRLKKGTEINVGKNDYLVVANEFKTALERAHTELTTHVFALQKGMMGRPVSEKDLMLDRRINRIVARIVGLFFLEHWNIYQPKSWAPVRTISDTNRETLNAVQSISSILGKKRFVLQK